MEEMGNLMVKTYLLLTRLRPIIYSILTKLKIYTTIHTYTHISTRQPSNLSSSQSKRNQHKDKC